ncbi:hypothetical protein [Succinimonas amylolytica]|uniref:hypothetical protein n=1 Tax=Succinimonas amylolytica TaxID=83769 RepID=UPI000378262B|nr:hypothetical protein [Succinimonas amylolytica]
MKRPVIRNALQGCLLIACSSPRQKRIPSGTAGRDNDKHRSGELTPAPEKKK